MNVCRRCQQDHKNDNHPWHCMIVGLCDSISTLERKNADLNRTIELLRQIYTDPPPDVQELVLDRPHIPEKIRALNDENATLRAEIETWKRRVDEWGAAYDKRPLLERRLRDAEAALKEICICAAVRTKDGQIHRGHRHGDCFQRMMARGVDLTDSVQGFITSRNRFVTRGEGRALQDAAGVTSVDPQGSEHGTLLSEDLY